MTSVFFYKLTIKLSGVIIFTSQKKADFIIAGHDSAYSPWVYLLEGESRGRSIDVIRDIADRTGSEVDFYPSQWSEIYPALLDRKIDIILNVGWPNDGIDTDRVKATSPYDHFETTLFVKGSAPDRGDKNREIMPPHTGDTTGSLPSRALRNTCTRNTIPARSNPGDSRRNGV